MKMDDPKDDKTKSPKSDSSTEDHPPAVTDNHNDERGTPAEASDSAIRRAKYDLAGRSAPHEVLVAPASSASSASSAAPSSGTVQPGANDTTTVTTSTPFRKQGLRSESSTFTTAVASVPATQAPRVTVGRILGRGLRSKKSKQDGETKDNTSVPVPMTTGGTATLDGGNVAAITYPSPGSGHVASADSHDGEQLSAKKKLHFLHPNLQQQHAEAQLAVLSSTHVPPSPNTTTATTLNNNDGNYSASVTQPHNGNPPSSNNYDLQQRQQSLGNNDNEEEVHSGQEHNSTMNLITATLVEEDSRRDLNNEETLEQLRQDIISQAVAAEEVTPVEEDEKQRQEKRKTYLAALIVMMLLLIVIVVVVVVMVIVRGGNESSSSSSSSSTSATDPPSSEACPAWFLREEPLLDVPLNEVLSIHHQNASISTSSNNTSTATTSFFQDDVLLTIQPTALVPCFDLNNKYDEEQLFLFNETMGQGFFKVTGTGTPMMVSFCPNPKNSINDDDIAIHIITLEPNDSDCGFDVTCVETTTTIPAEYNASSVSNKNGFCSDNPNVEVLNWASEYGATYYTVIQGFRKEEEEVNVEGGGGGEEEEAHLMVSALPNDECQRSIGPITLSNSFSTNGLLSLSNMGTVDESYNITEACSHRHVYEKPGHWYTVVVPGTVTSLTVTSTFRFLSDISRQDSVIVSVFSSPPSSYAVNKNLSLPCQELTCLRSVERTRGLDVSLEWKSEPESEYHVLIQGFSNDDSSGSISKSDATDDENALLDYRLFIKDAALAVQPPLNDGCANAIELVFPDNHHQDSNPLLELSWNFSSSSGRNDTYYNASRTMVIAGSTKYATMAEKELLTSNYQGSACHVTQIGPGVFYKVIGTGNVMRVSTCPGDVADFFPTDSEEHSSDNMYAPTIQIYQGDKNCGDGEKGLVCSENVRMHFCNAFPYSLGTAEWRTTVNQTYYILVHSFFEEKDDVFNNEDFEEGEDFYLRGNLLVDESYITVTEGDFLLSLEEFENDATLPGENCFLDMQVFCVDPCGVPPPLVLECRQQPTSIEFVFLGHQCYAEQNRGHENYECQDYNGGPSSKFDTVAYVEISDSTGRVYYSNWAAVYKRFEILDNGIPFAEFHNVSVYSSNVTTPETLLQTSVYNTLCLFSGLQPGDLFGALKVNSLTNDRQGRLNSTTSASPPKFSVSVRLPGDALPEKIILTSLKTTSVGSSYEEGVGGGLVSVSYFTEGNISGTVLPRGSRPFEIEVPSYKPGYLFELEVWPFLFDVTGVVSGGSFDGAACFGTAILAPLDPA